MRKMDKDSQMLWHYTKGWHLPSIMNDGRIKRTELYLFPNEEPAVWFSSNQIWEPSVCGGLLDLNTGMPCGELAEGMIRQTSGLVRIGVSADTPGLERWDMFCRTCGITAVQVALLETSGRHMGSNPKWWYAIRRDVPSHEWKAVEAYLDGHWTDCSMLDSSMVVSLLEDAVAMPASVQEA